MELNWVLFGALERTDFCFGPGSSNLIGGLEASGALEAPMVIPDSEVGKASIVSVRTR